MVAATRFELVTKGSLTFYNERNMMGLRRQMRKAISSVMLAVAAMLVLTVAGCSKASESVQVTKSTSKPTEIVPLINSSTESTISHVYTADAISNDLPISVDSITTAFMVKTPYIYVTAKVSDAPDNTRITAQWTHYTYIFQEQRPYYVVNPSSDEIIFNDTLLASGTRNISFGHASPQGGWPIGGYTVSLQVNGKKAAEIQFTVQSFVPTSSGYPYMPQLLEPHNGWQNINPDHPIFSWAGQPKYTEFHIELAKDVKFEQIVLSDNTSARSYIYPGILDYNQSYFWQVRAIKYEGQSIPGPWSAIFTLYTQQAQSLQR